MIQITYYGHACFEINYNGKSMLFDPFIRGNELAKNVDISKIKTDYIFITHAHSDHTAEAIEIAKQCNATIVGIYEVCNYLQNHGAPKIHPMNIGGSCHFEDVELKMIPAIHSSSFTDGTYGGIAGGYTIKTNDHHIYYAGDTALFSDMSLISKKYHLDIAILPIGGNFTMNYNDAIEAAKLLNVKKVIGMHYDTFGLIKINHEQAIQAFNSENIELNLMAIGSTIKL